MRNRPSKRGKNYQVWMHAHVAERIRALGRGNLSRGIRWMAEVRSKTWRTAFQARVQAALEAYDAGEDVGPALEALAMHVEMTPPWTLIPKHLIDEGGPGITPVRE